MSEKALWQKVRGLRRWGHVERHEDRLVPGLPDVHFVLAGKAGWLELKWVEKLRKDGSFVVPLRAAQVVWLDQYDADGGRCFVLTQVGRKYHLGRWPFNPETRILDIAWWWERKLDLQELHDVLVE